MTILLVINLGFAWGDSTPSDPGDIWHSLASTSYDTHGSGLESRPTVIRNVDVDQVIQADVEA